MKRSLDLTKGSIYKNLLLFALPIFFSQLLQSFYNIIDMIIVGKFIGSVGCAALGNVSSLIWVVNSIGAGISVGGTVLISKYTGAKDKISQKDSISTLFGVTFVLSIVITIITLLSYKTLFKLMDVPTESLQYAYDYMFIISLGFIFMFLYNSVCAVLKGLGDSNTPFYFMIVATVINVILDIIFVVPLKMGVKGAAISTLIAQLVCFILSMISLKRLYFKNEKLNYFNICKDKIIHIFKVSLPTIGQMVMVNISFLFITSSLNCYGLEVASASSAGMKILNLMTAPCWAIGQAVCTMVGQALGNKNIDRTRKIGKVGIKLNLLINFIVVIIFQIFAKQMISIFDSNPGVINEGIKFIQICCSIDCIVYSIMFTYNMFAVGLGYSLMGFFNSFIDSVFMRIIICYFLGNVLALGQYGVYWSVAFSSVIPAIIGGLYYRSEKWKDFFCMSI